MEILHINANEGEEAVCDLTLIYGFHRNQMWDKGDSFVIKNQAVRWKMNEFIKTLDNGHLIIYPKGRFATDLSFEALVDRFREWVKKEIYRDFQIPTRRWIGSLIDQGYNCFRIIDEIGIHIDFRIFRRRKQRRIEIRTANDFVPFYELFFDICSHNDDILKCLNCEIATVIRNWENKAFSSFNFETLFDLTDHRKFNYPDRFICKDTRIVNHEALDVGKRGVKDDWWIEFEEV